MEEACSENWLRSAAAVIRPRGSVSVIAPAPNPAGRYRSHVGGRFTAGIKPNHPHEDVGRDIYRRSRHIWRARRLRFSSWCCMSEVASPPPQRPIINGGITFRRLTALLQCSERLYAADPETLP